MEKVGNFQSGVTKLAQNNDQSENVDSIKKSLFPFKHAVLINNESEVFADFLSQIFMQTYSFESFYSKFLVQFSMDKLSYP